MSPRWRKSLLTSPDSSKWRMLQMLVGLNHQRFLPTRMKLLMVQSFTISRGPNRKLRLKQSVNKLKASNINRLVDRRSKHPMVVCPHALSNRSITKKLAPK